MKSRNLAIVAILNAIGISAYSAVSPNADHLVAVDPKKSGNYRKILASKLEVTQFNCGRAILMPPFGPEGSTSMYWISRNGQRTYYVTSISAGESLWQRTDGAHYPERAGTARVTRVDAEIPKRTAEMVREVWYRMLNVPAISRPIAPPSNVVLLDTTKAEFSLEIANAAPLYANLDFSLSFPGKKTKQLVDIWNALHEYCKVPTKKRPIIAARIEQQSKRLLAELK